MLRSEWHCPSCEYFGSSPSAERHQKGESARDIFMKYEELTLQRPCAQKSAPTTHVEMDKLTNVLLTPRASSCLQNGSMSLSVHPQLMFIGVCYTRDFFQYPPQLLNGSPTVLSLSPRF